MPDHPRIKFCGITSLHDAHLAAEAGAWALGMIFWPGSPRACDPAEAQAIGASLRRTLELCGVFVNATLGEIEDVAQAVPLSILQMHGDEGPSFCSEIARRTGARVMKASRIGSSADMQAARAFHTDLHLLDARVAGVRGGTGRTIDPELVAHHRLNAPLVLSGGLNAGNVAEAIGRTDPYAVDTASGTESEPGRKDPELLEAFADAVRSTASDQAPAAL